MTFSSAVARRGYRLRVSDAPFATALFPLGGPRGTSISVSASGGSLTESRTRTILLPDEPGAVVDPGPFDGPGGPVLVKQRLAVGDGPEVLEARRLLAHPACGGSDRQWPDFSSRGDRPLHRRGQEGGPAPDRGAGRADSVPGSIRSSSFETPREELAENDDQGDANAAPRGGVFGVAARSVDSQIDFEAKEDGTVQVEITDRFGEGGPEYGYRLTTVAVSPAFAIKLLLGNPNAGRQFVTGGRTMMFATGPGLWAS